MVKWSLFLQCKWNPKRYTTRSLLRSRRIISDELRTNQIKVHVGDYHTSGFVHWPRLISLRFGQLPKSWLYTLRNLRLFGTIFRFEESLLAIEMPLSRPDINAKNLLLSHCISVSVSAISGSRRVEYSQGNSSEILLAYQKKVFQPAFASRVGSGWRRAKIISQEDCSCHLTSQSTIYYEKRKRRRKGM
jgi:hypothetical protein